MNHKLLSLMLSLCIGVMLLTACSSGNELVDVKEQSEINIVSTIFPQYDWVREMIGEEGGINNTYLLDNGIDLHNFQPTTADIHTILSSDVFIYVGGESEEWVEDVLAQDVDHKVQAINLMELLAFSLKEEEMVEGMQSEGDEMEEAYDEHIWMSLRNAAYICNVIADTLGKVVPEHAQAYRKNADTYIEKLNQLDTEYTMMIENSEKQSIVVGDRFPFRYLVDDYQIAYYAAFSGCSAETEASFETIVFLAQKLDEIQLDEILVTETSDQKIAETIIENTKSYGKTVLVLQSMQSMTKEAAKTMTYLNVMQSNLEVLKQVLEG